MASAAFRVGLTRDFLRADGTLGYGDIGLGALEALPGVTWEFLAEDTPELRTDQVRGYDALLVLAPRITAATLAGADRLAIIARFGVGYDTVDLDACTAHGVLVTITPDGVRRPMATAAITLLLALSHRLLDKAQLTRAGRWSDKLDYMGVGLTGRTLGLIGLGNIGCEVARLSRPFDLRLIACDPYATTATASAVGAELVTLETLLRTADFICITCALTAETRHLLDADRLALVRPSAFLINVARGPIVDQVALTAALRAGRLQGAGIDVFEQEPVDPTDPLLALPNVIATPHALGWTDECFAGMGRSACAGIAAVAAGEAPRHVVNNSVVEQQSLQAKLRRYASRIATSEGRAGDAQGQ
jgi:phosphoglycerate dehydrogenase-like enzyme